jgi:uncharacterized membrane protein
MRLHVMERQSALYVLLCLSLTYGNMNSKRGASPPAINNVMEQERSGSMQGPLELN